MRAEKKRYVPYLKGSPLKIEIVHLNSRHFPIAIIIEKRADVWVNISVWGMN